MYCFPWGERRITHGGLINGFNKWAIWIFLTQVKEKHHFSSAVDENTKRSQTLILKFQSAPEMKGPITASVAPPSPVPPEERLSLFELLQKKKKKKSGAPSAARTTGQYAGCHSHLTPPEKTVYSESAACPFKVLIKLLH